MFFKLLQNPSEGKNFWKYVFRQNSNLARGFVKSSTIHHIKEN